MIETTPKSLYIGVFTCKTYSNYKKRWLVRIKNKSGKRINAGYFQTQNEAAEYYNQKAIEFLGSGAVLNKIVITEETTAKNPNWLKTNNGKYWKKFSKKEIIDIINKNTSENNSEDNKYIIKYIEGDDNAFGFLVTKYEKEHLWAISHENKKRKSVSGYFNNKTTRRNKGRNISYGEANLEYGDILVNGLMNVMKAIKTGRFQGIDFKKWSCQIMRNTWNDYARKKYNLEDWNVRNRRKLGRNFINRNKSKLVSIENDGY